MKIDSDIKDIFNKFNKICGNSPDLVTRSLNKNIGYMYFETVSSDDKISDFLTKSLINIDKSNVFNSLYNKIKNKI